MFFLFFFRQVFFGTARAVDKWEALSSGLAPCPLSIAIRGQRRHTKELRREGIDIWSDRTWKTEEGMSLKLSG